MEVDKIPRGSFLGLGGGDGIAAGFTGVRLLEKTDENMDAKPIPGTAGFALSTAGKGATCWRPTSCSHDMQCAEICTFVVVRPLRCITFCSGTLPFGLGNSDSATRASAIPVSLVRCRTCQPSTNICTSLILFINVRLCIKKLHDKESVVTLWCHILLRSPCKIERPLYWRGIPQVHTEPRPRVARHAFVRSHPFRQTTTPGK